MPLGAVNQAMAFTERAVWEKTDSTIMTASVPHSPGAHSMLRFSNQRVMYSTTVTLFSQIDHYIQNPCAAVDVGPSR